MKALVFDKSIPRYAVQKIVGPKRAARLAIGSAACLRTVSYRDIPEKRLPTGQWVRVASTLSGVCGSDLSVISGKGSTYFSPLTSTPFVFGHEVVGVVAELGGEVRDYESRHAVQPLSVGDRVVVEPALGCRVRGIEPMCHDCQNGHAALCRNVTRGDISAGIQTGYCRDTGGGWSERLVAHRAQLYRVPDELPDHVAVLAEPLACAIHGVLRADLKRNGTALVMGCGAIGLLTVAAIRARGFTGRLVAVAKHRHQQRLARTLGATEVLGVPGRAPMRQRYRALSHAVGAELHFPELGKPTVLGGADVSYDCVGSSASLDDSIRFTTGGGHVVQIGMPGVASGVDFTALWFKEISLHAAYAYGLESTDRWPGVNSPKSHSIELALHVLARSPEKFVLLVSQPYDLADYRRALHAAFFTADSRHVKTLFRAPIA